MALVSQLLKYPPPIAEKLVQCDFVPLACISSGLLSCNKFSLTQRKGHAHFTSRSPHVWVRVERGGGPWSGPGSEGFPGGTRTWLQKGRPGLTAERGLKRRARRGSFTSCIWCSFALSVCKSWASPVSMFWLSPSLRSRISSMIFCCSSNRSSNCCCGTVSRRCLSSASASAPICTDQHRKQNGELCKQIASRRRKQRQKRETIFLSSFFSTKWSNFQLNLVHQVRRFFEVAFSSALPLSPFHNFSPFPRSPHPPRPAQLRLPLSSAEGPYLLESERRAQVQLAPLWTGSSQTTRQLWVTVDSPTWVPYHDHCWWRYRFFHQGDVPGQRLKWPIQLCKM